MNDNIKFSFFRAPIRNTIPCEVFGIQDAYGYITGPIAKERTEKLRSMTSSNEAKRYKANDFDYCTFSGVFKHRSSSELIQHSGLICLDFDDVDDIPALKKRLLEHEYFETVLMFTSPSGNGVKWVVEVNLQSRKHSRFFKSMVKNLKATGLPPVDTSGSDVARACFLSHDPEAYINPIMFNNVTEGQILCGSKKKMFRIEDWEDSTRKTFRPSLGVYHRNSDFDDVESIVSMAERKGIDLAPSYEDWIKLGFALADGLGESGRGCFLRLSSLHGDYNEREANKKYTECLKAHGCGVTYATFFWMAQKAGINIASKQQA